MPPQTRSHDQINFKAPNYLTLFELLRPEHPWPLIPDVFGDAMHALALEHGVENSTAIKYGDKARDWVIAQWRDLRKMGRSLRIEDTKNPNWVFCRDETGQMWAMGAEVYAALHRREHEAELVRTKQKYLTMGRMDELNAAMDANPRVMRTMQGVYPMVVDPETRRLVILNTIFDDVTPARPTGRPTPSNRT
ncbi:MAG TPA: hypothetical protein VM536_16695 [Chloroflexia bacterium]|nr:hypothetical protein [Chloroflexia bacterium]